MSRLENKKGATKDDIVRIGTEIIGQGGFNATGIDAVLKRARVPKGSFYYYFSSKEAFGLAVIERSAQEYGEMLTGYLTDPEYTPLRRIRNYLEGGVARHENSECRRGCLIGNLGQELAAQNETFRQRLDEVLESWRKQFAECLREAKATGEIPPEADPDQLAGFLLTGWEGAILRAKVRKSVKPLREFIDVLFGKVLR
jgi:TetR/AcrR family transcriptional repressor of nem operon